MDRGVEQGRHRQDGPAGLAGADGSGLRWRGEFDCEGGTYEPGDAVEYRGSAFITDERTGGCVDPPNAPWQLLARGGTGSQGLTGPRGATGSTGPTGPAGIAHGYRGRWSYFSGDYEALRFDPGPAIVSVTVPPGTYVVNAYAALQNHANFPAQDNHRDVECWVEPSPNNEGDYGIARSRG